MQHYKHLLRAFLAAFIVILATNAFAAYRQGEIIVKYRQAAGVRAESAVSATVAGATAGKSIDPIRTRLIKLPAGMTVDAAIKRFKADPNVEYAGPNHILQLCLEPDDEYFFSSDWMMYWEWGLYDENNPNSGIHAPDAWDIETGSPSVIIAVVDTGIKATHEDLYAKIVPGRNCLASATDPTDTDDDHGHGTFVAGIAAAMTNNTIGIAGVSWGSMLMPIKVMNASGEGTEQDAADGIVWAADHGAQIINLSLGTYDDVQALHDAVDYAWNKGCVVVAASGNNDSSAMFYPASYDHCIAVGATNENAERCTPADWGTDAQGNAQGSNYGSYLDVVAPGNNIFSTTTTDELGIGPYTISAGTSAAAPFVSGIAALVMSHYPTWTNSQIRDQIESTCTDIDTPGWDQYTGWGLVNAYHALADPPPVPVAISDLNSLADGSRVRIPDAILTSASSMLYDRFYAEQSNRACGICLPFDEVPTGYVEGNIVTIAGMLQTINGERGIRNPTFTLTGNRSPLAPIAMSTTSVGGGPLGYKPGVTGGHGLNNVSLLVTVYGRVTATGWTYFYLDDGRARLDGSGLTGLKIITDQLTMPAKGSYVRVTGISSVEQPPRTSVAIPVIRVRKQADLVQVF